MIGKIKTLVFGCSPLLLLISPVYSQGPGIPQVTFPAADINKHISTIPPYNGDGNNLGAMVNGYMLIVFAPDGMAPGGGFGFYDISDPYNPVLVNSITPDVSLAQCVEVHGYGFSGNISAMQSHKGIMFWDLSDIMQPVMLSNLILSALPGGGYEGGNFATFWQAPYAYTASSNFGIHIVEAADPSNPSELKRLPKIETGNFLVGQVYAIGNLLMANTVGTEMDKLGVSLFDISDPADPKMFFTSKGLPASYSMLINGNKIYGSGNDGKVHVIDITNPGMPVLESSTATISNTHGEYIFVQDEFLFSGFDNVWKKVDLRTMEEVGGGTLNNGGQEGHPQPYGNFIMVGNDHGEGSGLFPHSEVPDTRGPAANMVNPAPGAINQAITSRVGLTFTDQIDVPSVNSQTFIVREIGGAQLTGTYSTQQAIINFWPDQPLKYSTEYEVVIPAGGIKDWSGNVTETAFTSSFTTAAETFIPPDPPEPVYISNDIITVTASSEEPNFPASNIIDGDPSTIWHTKYQPTPDSLPFDLTFQFSEPTGIQGITYVARSDNSSNGTITQYELFVSTDGANYTSVSSGISPESVTFDSVMVTHVRLRVLGGNGNFGSGAEVQFLSHIIPGTPVLYRERYPDFNSSADLIPGLYNLKGKLLYGHDELEKTTLPVGIYMQIYPSGKIRMKVSL